MINCKRARGRACRARSGFTLIETALTTIILGVGVLAMVAAQQAFHKKNEWSTHASIAMHLGNEIREMTLNLPRHDPVTGTEFWGPEVSELFVDDYDDLDDFDGPAGAGLVFGADFDDGTVDNGPINARREIIANMQGWSQEIRVFNVDPFDIRYDPNDYSSLPADASTNTILVEVIVKFQGLNDSQPTELTRVAWIAPN